MFKTLVGAVHWTARIPLWLAISALFAMMVLTFTDVLLRSFASAPIPGAAELTEVFLATTVFAAMPATSLWGRHISVDLFDSFVAARIREGLANFIFGILLFWPVVKCWESGARTIGYGEVTLYLRLPVGWIIYLIAAGMTLAACAMILRGIFILLMPQTDLADRTEGVVRSGT
ncbi:TRAP-type C4-dicarboxylate transport system, small permease component [Salinihabitans flavidus]|uniref:TRAP transporter small permease protein n=1 Tax=Salinihabitans flavidus TaxID=569882 RepID=A0A1H8RJL0_9RHOB|nr:TRAP transporter small permease [Salinihabitans flavidus]SEO66580.1 TRAP-type C4-dicarboxylate transport system, small permease component [Salinihabitans flavidus]